MKNGKPRIIYNDDTCGLRVVEPPHTEKDIAIAVDYLKGTQVDMLCWCMSSDIPYSYNSKIQESFFSIIKRKGSVAARMNYVGKTLERNVMLSLYDKGIDYLPILIGLAHKQGLSFIGSFRMNDTHHKSDPQGILTPAFWEERQDYRLWEVTDAKSYYNAALDYSHKEVRQRKLDMIAEVLENYDVDGIELDMCRNPYYFQPSEAWKKRGILTSLVRDVKEMVKSAGREKKKEMALIVRVPFKEDALRKAGMDVGRWVEEKLPDILVMSCLANEYNYPVEPWLGMCRENGVLFYPSVEADSAFNREYSKLPISNPLAPPHNYTVKTPPGMNAGLHRGMAQNFLAQGVDGIYMFNYPCTLFEGKCILLNDRAAAEKLTGVLSEMGSLRTLSGKDKSYMYYTDLPIYAEANRPSKYHQTVEFHVRGGDIRRSRAVISFRQVAEKNPHCYRKSPQPPYVEEGKLKYYLNGRELEAGRIRKSRQAGGRTRSGFVLRNHELVEIEAKGPELKDGINTLAVEMPGFPVDFDPYVYIYELEARLRF